MILFSVCDSHQYDYPVSVFTNIVYNREISEFYLGKRVSTNYLLQRSYSQTSVQGIVVLFQICCGVPGATLKHRDISLIRRTEFFCQCLVPWGRKL
jgi:hypothetical protein